MGKTSVIKRFPMKICIAIFAAVNAHVGKILDRHLAGASGWDYKTNNGEDWPSLKIANNECGKENTQSPIDLPSSGSSMYSADDDNFNKMYYNQKKTSRPA